MDEITKLEIMMQTLGVSNRLKIIKFTGSAERSVGEIVNFLNLSQSLVSHHLKALREKHILVTSRKGAFVYYKNAGTPNVQVETVMEQLGIGKESVICLIARLAVKDKLKLSISI